MPLFSRVNPIWPWLGLGGLTLGMGLMLASLYRIAQSEVTEQAAQVQSTEKDKFLTYARNYLDHARDSSLAELIAFHEEGLAYALGQWDTNNQIVKGSFVGQESLHTTRVPSPVWWSQSVGDLIDTFSSQQLTASERPDLFDPANGYHGENLESARYDGRIVAPVAGWLAHRADPEHPWVIWHKIGPHEPVRGAFIDVQVLLQELEAALPAAGIVEAAIIPASAAIPSENRIPGLPAYAIVFKTGEVLLSKQQNTRLIGIAAGFLLGTLALGGLLLVRSSQRHAREALRKTTFASLVSHELRTPITSIRIFADMVASADLPTEKRNRYAQKIQKESSRLSRLIEQLLDFNLLTQERRSAPLQETNLDTLVREVCELAEPVLSAAGLQANYASTASSTDVTTEPLAVRQALRNLLENAAKYAPNSGEVRVAIHRRADAFVVQVSDHGPGILPNRGEEIFEAFSQGQKELHNKTAGMGLGLAIARTGLRAAGAELSLLSTQTGATFEIQIPINPTA